MFWCSSNVFTMLYDIWYVCACPSPTDETHLHICPQKRPEVRALTTPLTSSSGDRTSRAGSWKSGKKKIALQSKLRWNSWWRKLFLLTPLSHKMNQDKETFLPFKYWEYLIIMLFYSTQVKTFLTCWSISYIDIVIFITFVFKMSDVMYNNKLMVAFYKCGCNNSCFILC